MSKDYYETLGISKTASKEDVKRAFRTLAQKYHPDKRGGDEKKFKEINEAYQILSDDKKRAEYDSYGKTFSDMGGGAGGFNPNDFGFDFSGFQQGQGGFQGFSSNGQDFNFDIGDIFGDIFGGGRESARRGRDISIDVEISFSESIFGAERKMVLNKVSVCDKCSGTGAEAGSKMETCPSCNGKGKLRENKRSLFGSFSSVKTCDTCAGKGQVPKDKCRECDGVGTLRREEEIGVKIPAGIDDGEMIRMPKAGEAVPRGSTGDLYVKVHVKPHSLFHKEGKDLITDLNIKLSTAILGGEYNLQTLEGEIKVTIPEGVSVGEILRVRGKGVPIDRNHRGDLLIKLHIQIPAKLSKEAKKLVEELREKGL